MILLMTFSGNIQHPFSSVQKTTLSLVIFSRISKNILKGRGLQFLPPHVEEGQYIASSTLKLGSYDVGNLSN